MSYPPCLRDFQSNHFPIYIQWSAILTWVCVQIPRGCVDGFWAHLNGCHHWHVMHIMSLFIPLISSIIQTVSVSISVYWTAVSVFTLWLPIFFCFFLSLLNKFYLTSHLTTAYMLKKMCTTLFYSMIFMGH